MATRTNVVLSLRAYEKQGKVDSQINRTHNPRKPLDQITCPDSSLDLRLSPEFLEVPVYTIWVIHVIAFTNWVFDVEPY